MASSHQTRRGASRSALEITSGRLTILPGPIKKVKTKLHSSKHPCTGQSSQLCHGAIYTLRSTPSTQMHTLGQKGWQVRDGGKAVMHMEIHSCHHKRKVCSFFRSVRTFGKNPELYTVKCLNLELKALNGVFSMKKNSKSGQENSSLLVSAVCDSGVNKSGDPNGFHSSIFNENF